MLSQSKERGHAPQQSGASGEQGSTGRGGLRRILWRLLLGMAFFLALLAIVVLRLLPALGRRGDLNPVVEDLLRSALSVPVRIDRVDTDPLSEFSITRLSSVATEAASRFSFRCERLAVFYQPLELTLGRRAREISLKSPVLRLDLDRDLSGILAPPAGGATGGPVGAPVGGAVAEGEGGGFRVDRLRIADGSFTALWGGREILLDNLDLILDGLGQGGPISFDLSARLLSARLQIRGDLSPPEGTRGIRRVRAAQIEIEGLRLRLLLAALGLRGDPVGGRLSFTGRAEGTWPEKVEVHLESRLSGGRAAFSGAPSLEGGEARLEIGATIEGEAERIAFHINLDGDGNLVEAKDGTTDGNSSQRTRRTRRTDGGTTDEEERGTDGRTDERSPKRRQRAQRTEEKNVGQGKNTEARVPTSDIRHPTSDIIRERFSLLAEGEFLRNGDSGKARARLSLSRASLAVPRLGRLEASGSMELSGSDPAIALEAHLPAFPLGKLQEHAIGAPLRGLLHWVEGALELDLHLRGSAAHPEVSLDFRLPDGALVRGGRRAPARITGKAGRIRREGDGLRLEGLQVKAEGIDLAALPLEKGFAGGLALSGLLEVEAEAAELLLPEGKTDVRLRYRCRNGKAALAAADLEIPQLALDGEAHLAGTSGGRWDLDLAADLSVPEFALGPLVESPGAIPIQLRARAALVPPVLVPQTLGAPGPARLDVHLDLGLPSTGPIAIEGALSLPENASPEYEFKATLPAIPAARLLATTLRDPLLAKFPWLEGAEFQGEANFEARAHGRGAALRFDGTLRAKEIHGKFQGGEIEGLEVEVPFALGSSERKTDGNSPRRHGDTETNGRVSTSDIRHPTSDIQGLLRFRKLTLPTVDLRNIRVPFSFDGSTYRVPPGQVFLPLWKGRVDLGSLELEPGGAAGQRLRLSLLASDLDLGEILPRLGVPPFPARARLEIRDLRFSPELLELNGLLTLEVFGGRVELRGISIERPFRPYRVFSLDTGVVIGLDLGRLGRDLRFGIASGVIDGELRRLRFTAEGVERFEALFRAVRMPGVAQYLNKAAIENLHRLLAGPFGMIEEAFFSKFHFSEFGFECSLEKGRFRLRGLYPSGGKEYIMYSRWYLFPRVEIVNARPAMVYDWENIFENLTSIQKENESSPPAGGAKGNP